MIYEVLLHLPGSLLAQQVAGGGLDKPGEQEAGAVPLLQQHEVILEELPGDVSAKPPDNTIMNQWKSFLSNFFVIQSKKNLRKHLRFSKEERVIQILINF